MIQTDFVTWVVASAPPSLCFRPKESIRLNTQRGVVLQGVSLVLLEYSPCVSLAFLTPKPLPRAQSQSLILNFSSLETFFCLPPVHLPEFLPSHPMFPAAGTFPDNPERSSLSGPPPQVPQDAHSFRSCNQALSTKAHFLMASLCCPLFCGSSLKTWPCRHQPPQQPLVSVSSSSAHVITKTASLIAMVPWYPPSTSSHC